jgi:hypothetical protein
MNSTKENPVADLPGDLRRLNRKIDAFRKQRLDVIAANNGFVPHQRGDEEPDSPVFVLHLVPLHTFEDEYFVDTRALDHGDSLLALKPITMFSGWDRRFNLEGVVGFDSGNSGYTQLFRNGALEAVSYAVLAHDGEARMQPWHTLGHCLVPAVKRYFTFLKDVVKVEPPVYLMLSFLRAEKYTLTIPHGKKLGVENLVIPRYAVTNLGEQPQNVLRRPLDIFFQAFGQQGCPKFNAEGRPVE